MRRLIYLSIYFHYFVFIFPWNMAWPFIWTNMISHHRRMLCAKFGWNWPVVLEKKMKMWKVYRRTDGRTTDIRRSEKLTWAFSSGEIKTTRKKVSVRALGLLSSFTCAWARNLSSIYKNTTQAHWVSSTWLRWRTFWCW